MGDRQSTNLLQEVFIKRQPAPHRLTFESENAGGNELQPEEITEKLADLPVRNIQLVA